MSHLRLKYETTARSWPYNPSIVSASSNSKSSPSWVTSSRRLGAAEIQLWRERSISVDIPVVSDVWKGRIWSPMDVQRKAASIPTQMLQTLKRTTSVYQRQYCSDRIRWHITLHDIHSLFVRNMINMNSYYLTCQLLS